jgi:periplasmic protein CpxP/Spy
MKKSLRSLLVVAGLASATALGCNFALADDTAAPAAPPARGEHRQGCEQGRHAGKHQRGEHFARLAKKLGLSEQQRAQAKTIFQANRAQAKPLFAGLKGERHQLRQLIHSGSADEAAIRAQSAKVAAIEADLAVQRARGAKQLMALLTPDQLAKFKALQAQREQKHPDHDFEGREHGPRE